MPLIGDVVKKVEGSASGIREKVGFIGEDDSDIKDAQKRLKAALEKIQNKYEGKDDGSLIEEAKALLVDMNKASEEEKKAEKKTQTGSLEKKDYYTIRSAIPGAPNFDKLTKGQKNFLQKRYFHGGETPDLDDVITKKYFEKAMQTLSEKATPSEMKEIILYTLDHKDHLIPKMGLSPGEKSYILYLDNYVERQRRYSLDPNKTNLAPTGEDLLIQKGTHRALVSLFGGPTGGGH